MIKNLILIAIISLSLAGQLSAQTSQNHTSEIIEWQTELNEEFRDKKESPLEKKDFKKFQGLNFFTIDSTYRIEARFERTPFATPFQMITSTSNRPTYVVYGKLTFTLKGETFTLSVYQSKQLTTTEGYEDYLFLPFTDLSNDHGSYGGGRYIDMRIPDTDTVIVDFNKAYNPYCAYSGRYSCPVPPAENDLPIAIYAGVKAWDDH